MCPGSSAKDGASRVIRTRMSAPDNEIPFPVPLALIGRHPQGEGADRLLLAVEFADGRRAGDRALADRSRRGARFLTGLT